ERRSEKIAGGKVFSDAVAIEFPVAGSVSGEKPYFGEGDSLKEVNLWYWRSKGSSDGTEKVKLINVKGYSNSKGRRVRKAKEAGLTAVGEYEDGTWRVVMRHPLEAGSSDVQFAEGDSVPVAFALWDGSNGEKGSAHTLTTWHSLRLAKERSGRKLLWPVLIALLVLCLELTWISSLRKNSQD
ncbi:MAG: ethylbenzene dehydrogenase-related protein, partial [Thermodesulfobacteriota bacterium]